MCVLAINRYLPSHKDVVGELLSIWVSDPDSKFELASLVPINGDASLSSLTHLEPQSRSGGKLLEF